MSGYIQYHFYIDGDDLKNKEVRKKALEYILKHFTYEVLPDKSISVYSNFDDYSDLIETELAMLYDDLKGLGVTLKGYAVVEEDSGFCRMEFDSSGGVVKEYIDPIAFLENHTISEISMIKNMIDREFDQH